MREAEFDASLNEIQENQLRLISQIRDEISVLIEQREISEVDATLVRLLGYFSGRSQTLSVLVSDNYLLDAEIILRSLNECFAKICFISYQDENNKSYLVNEFWHQLGLANNHRKRHRAKKAEAFARAMGQTQDEKVFRALSSEKLYDFNEMNKKDRKALEQKWSYSEIIRFLDSGVVQGAPPDAFSALTHMYGMQSHLAHCDQVALDLIADDACREPEIRVKKAKAHACRIWSDQISLWVFTYTALKTHFGEKVDYTARVWSDWEKHVTNMRPFSQSFWDTQSDFYEEYAPDV